jgi:hypothetical protein
LIINSPKDSKKLDLNALTKEKVTNLTSPVTRSEAQRMITLPAQSHYRLQGSKLTTTRKFTDGEVLVLFAVVDDGGDLNHQRVATDAPRGDHPYTFFKEIGRARYHNRAFASKNSLKRCKDL